MTFCNKAFLRTFLTSFILSLMSPQTQAQSSAEGSAVQGLNRVQHFVIIYQENYSYDSLYGGWEGTDGWLNTTGRYFPQQGQDGKAFKCLHQVAPMLASPPLAATCHDTGHDIHSAFSNEPFPVDVWYPENLPTCPEGKPGGCTPDLVHSFYTEQYQIHDGAMDRFATGSDASGLAMGHYQTHRLPVYRYLHQPDHPHYVIFDRWFQAAFGGSFLNHQWLIAATTPFFAGAEQSGDRDLHSRVDSSGMSIKTPLYHPLTDVRAGLLTARCDAVDRLDIACGDFAVGSVQPWFQPYRPGTPDWMRLKPLRHPSLADRLLAAGISWAWFSGGWSNASGAVGQPGWSNGEGPRCSDPSTMAGAVYPYCPDRSFQFHHQPFNYFALLDPSTAQGSRLRQEHLRDEQDFISRLDKSTMDCQLPAVSFVKPLGIENEHPGYASEYRGSRHLVSLIDKVESSVCAADTVVMVTYDEFGGYWDHVAPPGQGHPHPLADEWGPGTRIPALMISPLLPEPFAVDSDVRDSTTILATLEHRFGLSPLGRRDAVVRDLSAALTGKDPVRKQTQP